MTMAGVVIIVLVAIIVTQLVMISALRRELRKCRSRELWGMQVQAGKKDLAVVR